MQGHTVDCIRYDLLILKFLNILLTDECKEHYLNYQNVLRFVTLRPLNVKQIWHGIYNGITIFAYRVKQSIHDIQETDLHMLTNNLVDEYRFVCRGRKHKNWLHICRYSQTCQSNAKFNFGKYNRLPSCLY